MEGRQKLRELGKAQTLTVSFILKTQYHLLHWDSWNISPPWPCARFITQAASLVLLQLGTDHRRAALHHTALPMPLELLRGFLQLPGNAGSSSMKRHSSQLIYSQVHGERQAQIFLRAANVYALPSNFSTAKAEPLVLQWDKPDKASLTLLPGVAEVKSMCSIFTAFLFGRLMYIMTMRFKDLFAKLFLIPCVRVCVHARVDTQIEA